MTFASFPMTSISSKAHKIDFSYFLFTVDATFLYYVQSRNLAEKISFPAELVVPVRVTQTLLVTYVHPNVYIIKFGYFFEATDFLVIKGKMHKKER